MGRYYSLEENFENLKSDLRIKLFNKMSPNENILFIISNYRLNKKHYNLSLMFLFSFIRKRITVCKYQT